MNECKKWQTKTRQFIQSLCSHGTNYTIHSTLSIRREWLTLVFAAISAVFTTGSACRLCLLCWFILLFIQIMTSLTILSTFCTSASSRWSYGSSFNSKSVGRSVVKRMINTFTQPQVFDFIYLHFEGFHNLHVLLQLLSQLLKSFWSLLILCVSVLNGLAQFLQNNFYSAE